MRTGALSPGEQLPPVRELADSAGVSAGTAAAAYRLLRARGITVADGRRGTRVRERPSVAGRASDARAVPPGVVDCSTGNPDPALLPDLAPALRRVSLEPVVYGAAPCSPELATAARERLGAEQVPFERVTATFGALDAIERLLASELRPGDRVAVEDPGWASSLDLVTAAGYVPAPMTVDDDGPLPDALERALRRGAKVVVVTARAENPTGASVSATRAAALRDVLAGFGDVLVIEDDHGFGIVREPLHAVAGSTDRWAFVRSAAKAYGPDLRLAVVAGDETTIDRVEARLALGAGWVSHLLQRLLVELWRDPATDAALERAAAAYDARRAALLEPLAARGIEARGRTGLNCWIPVADEAGAVGALLRSGWLVAPGSRFRLGAAPAVRVTTASLEVTQTPELVEALAAVVAPGARSGARRLS